MGGQKMLSLVSSEAHRQESERRRNARYRVLLKAKIITTTHEQPVKVRDISLGGALIESDISFVENVDVMLRRGSTDLFARVAWASGNRCGLAFDGALTDPELADFVHQPARAEGRLPEALPPRPTIEPEQLTPEQWAMVESWGRPVGRGAFGE